MPDLSSGLSRSVVRSLSPAFLALACVLGGASQGAFVATGVLEVIASILLAGCILAAGGVSLQPSARWLFAVFLVFAAVALMQLLPLPLGLWRLLPARDFVLEGYRLVGLKAEAAPMSLAPYETLTGLLRFLPPLAAFTLAATLPGRRATAYLPWTIVILAVSSVAFGLAQVFGGRESPLYLYDPTNVGSPVGFMANVNHQSTLLLMSIPFAALLLSRQQLRGHMGDSDVGQMMLIAALALFICFGVLIAGSTAGYALLGPAILFGILVFRGAETRRSTALTLALAALGVGVLSFVVANNRIVQGLGVTDFWSTGTMSRQDLYARTWRALLDYLPFGSGLGSFRDLYPRYEDSALVTSTWANHAHNDYLEFVLEMGLPGLLILLSAIVWWAWRTSQIWRSDDEETGRIQRAASLAVGVVILHSLVDYPLRTGAVATFAGLCLGVMAGPARRQRDEAELAASAARHVEL